MNKIVKKYLPLIKKPKTLIILGVMGIALIFLSTLGGQNNSSPQKTGEFSAEEYKEALEKDITKLVKSISGSRRVTVVITLESGLNYQYADTKEGSSQEKNDKDTTAVSSEVKEGYITVKNADGSERAILLSEQMPEIRGVAIVCEGGDNLELNEKIQNAVTSALNITSKRVYIAGGN